MLIICDLCKAKKKSVFVIPNIRIETDYVTKTITFKNTIDQENYITICQACLTGAEHIGGFST